MCNLRCVIFVLFACAHVFAAACRITAVQWVGERESYEESQVQALVGKSCESWPLTRDRIVSYYENRGFLSAKLMGDLDSAGVLTVSLDRGIPWVWADPENLDSSGSDIEVFRRQTRIEPGKFVSPLELERSDMKMASLGYYNRTRCATALFRCTTCRRPRCPRRMRF